MRIRSGARRLSGSALGSAALSNLLLAVVGASTGIVAARVLGPDQRGTLAAVQIPALLLASFGVLGLGDAVVHFARSGTVPSDIAVGTALSVTLISTAAMSLLAAPLLPLVLGPEVMSENRSVAFLWLALPVLTAFSAIAIQTYRCLDEDPIWNRMRVLPALTWLVALVSSLAIGSGQRLMYVSAIQLASLMAIGAVVWVHLRWKHNLRPRLGVRSWRPMLKYGLPLTLTSLPQMLNTRLDQLILVRQVTSIQLGQYVAGYAWSALATPVISAFGIVAFPRISAMAGDRVAALEVVDRYVRPALIAGVLLGGLGAAVAPVAIPFVFGAEYRGGLGAAQVLSVGGVLLAWSGVLAGFLQGLSRTRAILTSELGGLAVTLVALLLLVPRYGTLGAAVASVLAYTATLLMRLLAVASGLDVSATRLLRGRGWGRL